MLLVSRYVLVEENAVEVFHHYGDQLSSTLLMQIFSWLAGLCCYGDNIEEHRRLCRCHCGDDVEEYRRLCRCHYGDDMEEYRRLCRWEDNIKIGLKEMGADVMNWMKLTRD